MNSVLEAQHPENYQWSIMTGLRTGWQEAENEPLIGKRAVFHTMVNRVKDGRWGQTIAAVCHARWQFSAWWAGDVADTRLMRHSCELPDNDLNLVALRDIFMPIIAGTDPDPTGGATHYYNPHSVPQPHWVHGDPAKGIKGATLCGQFGSQLFYKDVP